MKNNLLKQLMFFGVMLFSGVMLAQTVTGTVTSYDGLLPGVTVVVKGTSNGVSTDFDGKYSIDNVASDATLVFSYLGYSTLEVPVNNQSTINVKLEEDAQALDEIVVIGYGSTTVKDATGSVAAVNSEDFNQGVITSPEQLIQGKTAGVQIGLTSGEPGAGIDIRIRGTNSVRSNNNPLFVVDGIPLAAGGTSGDLPVSELGSQPPKNPLNFLNPNDIASISILKDASATAIYGSRGSNGVVIITTKTGRTGKGVFEFDFNTSISNPSKTFNILDRNSYLSESARLGYSIAERDFGSNTDWQDVIYRDAVSTNQNLAYSKNYGDGNFRATFGRGLQNGIVETSTLERITGRLNGSHNFLDGKLKINYSGSISRVNDNTAPLAGTAGFRGDIIGSSYAANPTWPNDPDFDQTGGFVNPANLLKYTQSETKTNRYMLSLSAEYKLNSNLTAKVSGGYDYADSDARNMSSKDNLLQGIYLNGRGDFNRLEFQNTLMEATVNYKKDLGNGSRIDVLGGFSYQKFDRQSISSQAWGFSSGDLNQMASDLAFATNSLMGQIEGSYQQFGYGTAFQTGVPVTGNVFINRLQPTIVTDFASLLVPGNVQAVYVDTFDNFDEIQSFFTRINYTHKNKFLVTATVRADGSTVFGEGNQYGVFPSGAVAWKINEEDFIGDNVSTLKLRLNAGVTGNQEGVGYGNAVRRTRFNGTNVSNSGEIGIPGTSPVAFENRDLKWESTLQYGGGIDFGFNNDRLSGSVDVYQKETKDLLFNINSAQPAIQPFRFVNLPNSKIVNKGIELAIGYDFVQTEDLTWNVNFNIASNDNMVESLSGEYNAGSINGQGLTGAFSQNLKEGYPLFSWYLREFQGFDSSGSPLYGGDGGPSFVGKSALPTVTGGLSTSLNYKRWNLNAYFNGAFGHYLYNATRNAFFTAGSFASSRNVLAETLTSGESTNASAAPSTRFLEKGDFIRLQNLSVSYNMPLSGEGLFKSMVFSLTGQNLFVITDYSGLDPEVSSRTSNGLPTLGIDYGAFPNPRTITFGINAKF